MPLISVIVPVYNVEAYLPACVDSILSQTFEDFELILIDDGSPDNCGAICDAYARKDARIRVIHQENGGLSAARNTGLDAAAGECITFVDSDDVISTDFLEVLYTALVQNNTEVSCCKFLEFENDQSFSRSALLPSQSSMRIMTGQDAVLCIYNGIPGIGINACAKLYSKKLFHERRFPVGKIHEDQALVPKVVYAANAVAMVDKVLYGYRAREESITSATFSNRRYDDIWAIDECIGFFESRGEEEIALAARKKREIILAKYAILARHAGVTPPEEYRVPIGKALRCLRKNVSNERLEWYLGMVHPRLPVIFEYGMWLKRRISHG